MLDAHGRGRLDHDGPAVRPAARPSRPPRARARLLAAAAALLVPVLAGATEPELPPGTPSFFTAPGPASFAAPVEALPRPADLTLVFFDPTSVLPRGFDAVAEEVRGIFHGLGVETSWRTGGNFGGGDVPEVPVILLPRDPLAGRRGVLGLVVRDQQPQRAVWLFGAAVREVLNPTAGASAVDPGLLDRALARIAAHEIVHAIAPEAPHARYGLMRHALSRRFLVGAQAPIDPRCASTFVTQLSLEWQRRLSSLGAAASPRP